VHDKLLTISTCGTQAVRQLLPTPMSVAMMDQCPPHCSCGTLRRTGLWPCRAPWARHRLWGRLPALVAAVAAHLALTYAQSPGRLLPLPGCGVLVSGAWRIFCAQTMTVDAGPTSQPLQQGPSVAATQIAVWCTTQAGIRCRRSQSRQACDCVARLVQANASGGTFTACTSVNSSVS
jgi:hypothetical protein